MSDTKQSDPKRVLRIHKGFKLHPDTVERIKRISSNLDCSQGRLIDYVVRHFDNPTVDLKIIVDK